MVYIIAKEWNEMTTDDILRSIDIAIRVLKDKGIKGVPRKVYISELATELLKLTLR